MINIIVVFLIILNLFSIFMLNKMLKGTETQFRVVSIIALIIVNFVILNIIYSISKIGISEEVATKSKAMIMFTAFPINLIAMAAPIAVQIRKARLNEIEKDKFIKNIVICIIIDIILLCIECAYIKNIQFGIEEMRRRINEKT